MAVSPDCIIQLLYIPLAPVSWSNYRFLRSLSVNTSLLQSKYLSSINEGDATSVYDLPIQSATTKQCTVLIFLELEPVLTCLVPGTPGEDDEDDHHHHAADHQPHHHNLVLVGQAAQL